VTLKEDKLQNLKCYLQWQQNIFSIAAKSNTAAVYGSVAV
jgi:hypothetical protein